MTAIARPVVAGVDGSASALKAVRMAAGEARRRNRALRLVHASRAPNGRPPEAALRREAQRILKDAAWVAADAEPDVPVSTDVVAGHPAAVLMDEARDAELLVIGDRGLGGFTGLLAGSVAVQVTAHSATRVLVCKGEEHPGGQVVVGVDGSPDSVHAIDAAFIEAALCQADLCAVHTWTGSATAGPDEMLPLANDGDEVKAEEKRVLAEALSGFRTRYPDVTVQELLIKGPAARSLRHLSQTARLLVLGSRGRGGFAGLLLGSVSQQLLHHSSCPVLIIPAAPADRPRPLPAPGARPPPR